MFTTLKSKIIWLITLVLATTAGGIMYFTNKDVGEAMVKAEEASANNVLQLVQINIEGAYNRLLSDKYEIISRLGKELRQVSGVSSGIFNQYQYLSNSGQVEDAVARRLALEWLRSVDFGQSEVFVFGIDGRIIAHTDTAMEGLQLDNLRDLKGRSITKAMRFDALRSTGDNAVFTWQKVGQTAARKNMGFFVPVKDWQWTLGVTIDFEDIEAESERKMGTLIDVLRKTFGKIQLGQDGYAFLFTGDKKEILIPPKWAVKEETDRNKSLPADYVTKHPKVNQLLSKIKASYDTGDGSLHYADPFDPSTQDVIARVSYFRTFDWYFAVVVPEEEMRAPAKALLTRQSIIIGLIFLGSVLAAFVVVVRISRPLNILTNYAKDFAAQQFGAMDSDDSAIVTLHKNHKDEVGRLAEAFIYMKSELKKNIQHAIESTAAKERLEKEAAEESNKAKSQFLANMSHEIRTPIHGMMGMTEILLKSDVDSKQQRFLQTIRRSGEMLVSIVNDILDFSKLDAKKLELESNPFRIGELIEGIGEQFAEAAHKKGIEVVCDVPRETFDTYVGDPFRLRQVLTNLCGNAIKFTDHGEVVIRARTLKEDNNTAHIEFLVKDTGIGISKDDQITIFESFAQADVSSTKRYAGTGLGLAISRKLVSLMGGEIELASEREVGSCFRFLLELTKDPSELAPDVPTAELEGLHVLVVDDNEEQRNYLTRTIGQWVEKVAAAEDALFALGMLREAAARGRPYDWVVIDRVMNPMSGIELIRTMMSEPEIAKARIALMNSFESALGLEAGEVMAQKYGELSIMKPIRQTDLIETLAGDRDDEVGLDVENSDGDQTDGNGKNLSAEVLVAEDNLVNQELAKEMLRSIGCNPTIVDNGLEAFNLLEVRQFDIVLMDCHMPEMDGYSSTEAIRKREDVSVSGGRLPIIALTANAMRGDKEKCLAAGMDDYLSKPFAAEQLQEVLSRWIWNPEAAAHAVATDQQTMDDIIPPDGNEPDEQIEKSVLEQAPLDQIRTLQRSGQPDLLAKVIEIYLSNSIDLMEQLATGVHEVDAEAVSHSAHALKSSSANLGAMALSEMCREMEAKGRIEVLDGSEELLEDMQIMHEKVCKELSREKDNSESDAQSVALTA